MNPRRRPTHARWASDSRVSSFYIQDSKYVQLTSMTVGLCGSGRVLARGEYLWFQLLVGVGRPEDDLDRRLEYF